MSGPELITLGCRLNFAESEAMRAMAADRDDLVIINSCAVTAEAVRKTRQQIRKARRARPEAEIVVTGCAVQTEPDTFTEMPEVNRLLGNREKMAPESFTSDQSLVVGHHGRARNSPASGHRLFGPRPRLCRSAKWLRSSLHLLRDPLWPREQPLRSGRSGRGSHTSLGR